MSGRTGRRPGSEDTRGRILAAARDAFGERGLDGASIRDIAGRAGVDPALVHHYFGSKQRLFMAATEFPVDPFAVVSVVAGGPREGTGERLVRSMVALWDRPEVRPLLLGVIRSAVTDEIAAGMARAMLTQGPFLAIARALGTPDAELRATLAGTHLLGLVVARYLVRVEPVASMSGDELAAVVGPVIERYLLDDLGPTAGPAAG